MGYRPLHAFRGGFSPRKLLEQFQWMQLKEELQQHMERSVGLQRCYLWEGLISMCPNRQLKRQGRESRRMPALPFLPLILCFALSAYPPSPRSVMTPFTSGSSSLGSLKGLACGPFIIPVVLGQVTLPGIGSTHCVKNLDHI